MKRTITTVIALMLALSLSLSACSLSQEGQKQNAEFSFGPSTKQPETIDEFMPLFAKQVKQYNEIAPQLWPGNTVANIKVVIDDIDTGRLWLVDANGLITPLSEDEANKMGVDRLDQPDDWRFFAPPSDDETEVDSGNLDGANEVSGSETFGEPDESDDSEDLDGANEVSGSETFGEPDESDDSEDLDGANEVSGSKTFTGSDETGDFENPGGANEVSDSEVFVESTEVTGEDSDGVPSDTDDGGVSGTYYSYTESEAAFEDGYLYFSVSQKSLSERGIWGRYPHVNIYSVILSLVHESFHAYEQVKWETPNIPVNMEGDLELDNTGARNKRDLLTRQLMLAVSHPEDEQLILEALATYQDYKTYFLEDYEKAILWDRQEGTAQYFEVMLSLMIGFSDQIKDEDDFDKALIQLANEEAYHQDAGIVGEAYDIGIFAGILLDRLGIDWKEPLMKDPLATPLELLYQHFAGETLPQPMEITAEDAKAVTREIELKKEDIRDALQMSIDMYEEEWEGADDERRAEIEELIKHIEEQIEERTK